MESQLGQAWGRREQRKLWVTNKDRSLKHYYNIYKDIGLFFLLKSAVWATISGVIGMKHGGGLFESDVDGIYEYRKFFPNTLSSVYDTAPVR